MQVFDEEFSGIRMQFQPRSCNNVSTCISLFNFNVFIFQFTIFKEEPEFCWWSVFPERHKFGGAKRVRTFSHRAMGILGLEVLNLFFEGRYASREKPVKFSRLLRVFNLCSVSESCWSMLKACVYRRSALLNRVGFQAMFKHCKCFHWTS